MPTTQRIPNGLYAITDGPRVDLVEACAAALRGGARILQYRDKSTNRARRLAEAGELAILCAQHGVPLIINDDVELARASAANGVHLGAKDAQIEYARSRLGPDAIIGATCHASLERAQRAARAGADYLAFGAFHSSPSKPNATRAAPKLLHDAQSLDLPLVAIGGVTPENGAELIAAGADCLAAISAVFGESDIMAAAQRFARLFPQEPRIR